MTAPRNEQPLCTVSACSNPARDGFVCDPCIWGLRGDLRAIAEVKQDLLVTLTRQDVGDRQPSGRVEVEPPLLYRPEASDAERDLNATLTAWAGVIARSWGVTMRDVLAPPPPGQKPDNWLDERGEWATERGLYADAQTLELALWLERHTGAVRANEQFGGQIVEEIGNAVARARQATDRPGARVYLGPCVCEHTDDARQVDLYARPDAARVTCWNCEAVWDVTERREWLLTESASVLITGEMATRALPSLLDYDLTPDLLRKMRNRQNLPVYPPAGGDPHRRDRYRVGDIVMAVAARKAAAAKRYAAAPPLDELPPDMARLFEAARQAAAAGHPIPAGPSTRPDTTARSG